MATSSPPTTFHLFSRLPPELRDLIWFFCLPRRVVPLDDPLFHSWNQDEQQCWVGCRQLDRRAKAPPFTASVCREARRVAFCWGGVEDMDTGTSLTHVWIQRKLDTLLFGWTYESSAKAGHGEDMMRLFLWGQRYFHPGGPVCLTAEQFLKFHPSPSAPESDYAPHLQLDAESKSIAYLLHNARGDEHDVDLNADLSDPMDVDVVMQTVYIHARRSDVFASQLFGRIADEPSQLVDYDDTATLAKFRALFNKNPRNRQRVALIEKFDAIESPEFPAQVARWLAKVAWKLLAIKWLHEKQHNPQSSIYSDPMQVIDGPGPWHNYLKMIPGRPRMNSFKAHFALYTVVRSPIKSTTSAFTRATRGTASRELCNYIDVVQLTPIRCQRLRFCQYGLLMGIKNIYGELGSGQRVSLSKLAADTLKAQGRPLRLAIDVAIWQFQAQAARGGTNPAIRTLFYRLVRLLAIPIQPVLVFDGPNKPTTKRNKRSGRGDGVANSQAKRLIRLFGLPVLDAPGEAEAECALLQRHGIVDAVLSEDVDTIMFGCTKTLRNWSSESKSNTAPTHVSLYDTAAVANHGLDRQGMVLVAMMSGGDYLPDGIPGCGVKVACEAANAGFGTSLCSLKASDTDSIRAWRAELRHELTTNESGHFRTKHKSLHIPDDFPNMEVLRYYTHPVVSPQNNLDTIRQKVQRDTNVDIESLREFTRETFDWDYREGALKFIRVLGQAMLVQNLTQSRNLIQDISKRRTHFSTDATSELRLSYIPQEVVPIDLSTEAAEDINYGRDGLALNSDDDFVPSQGTEAKTPQSFDITVPELAWVLEDVARHYAPESILQFETAEAAKALRKSPKKKPSTKATKATKPAKDAGMPKGAIDNFFRITKKSDPTTESVLKEKPPSPRKTLPSPSIDAIIQSQELPPLPRPPKTPPRSPSKQTGTSATGSPDKDATRLHMPPRPSQSTVYSETIVISSSPPCPSPPSTAPCSQAAASQSATDASPICSQPAAAPSPSRIKAGPRRLQKSKKLTASEPAPKFKQTSLDIFTSRKTTGPKLKVPALPYLAEKQLLDDPFDDASLLSIADMVPPEPSSPSKRRSQESQAAGGDRSGSPTPSRRKKKLLIPGTAGTLREIEVDVDEREGVIAREEAKLAMSNAKGKVARWSDVSIIDLTEE